MVINRHILKFLLLALVCIHAISPTRAEPQVIVSSRISAGAVFFGGDVGPDIDHDGIDDAWEWQHLGKPQGDLSSLFILGSRWDFDLDGHRDVHEWLAGTSPTDPLSILHLIDPVVLPDGSVVIAWASSTNDVPEPRKYDLYCAATLDDLLNNPSALATNLAASPDSMNTFTHVGAASNDSQILFYRIELSAPRSDL